jgi:hypothetical protein
VSGIISDSIAEALKKDEAESQRPRRESGTYEVEVTSVAIEDNPKPWIEKGLKVKARFLDDIAGEHECLIELSPCTGKDGSISPGKIKFLRWQLGALGLDHEELAFQLFGIIGNRYEAQYKVDDGLNEDGTPRNPKANLNPHTGKPYINRDLVFKKKIESPAEVAEQQEGAAEAHDAEAE